MFTFPLDSFHLLSPSPACDHLPYVQHMLIFPLSSRRSPSSCLACVHFTLVQLLCTSTLTIFCSLLALSSFLSLSLCPVFVHFLFTHLLFTYIYHSDFVFCLFTTRLVLNVILLHPYYHCHLPSMIIYVIMISQTDKNK